MKIDVRKANDVVIVDFEGRLAIGVGDEVLSEVVNELLTEGYKKILLNLSEVDFIDSSGLGELVQSMKMSQRVGASLHLLKPQDRVRKTLNLTKILPMFPIHETESDALASFSG
jgi:anti-sigma B factor antagonist